MRMNPVLALIVFAFASSVLSQEPEGFYTEEQAAQGKALYEGACAACHGLELRGGAASGLSGPRFARGWNAGSAASDLSGWGSSSVSDLYFIIRTTMPQGSTLR